MSRWQSHPLVQLLEELTLIDSGTENPVGVQAVQKVVERELKKLGLNPFWEKASGNPTGQVPILVASRSGKSGVEKFVDLVTHADTAWVKPSDRFRLDEKAATPMAQASLTTRAGSSLRWKGLLDFSKSRMAVWAFD